ncbi:MAG: prepilin-type N-terminal cleavage/methylation domain-containing protein [Deltaproteobacteria bacterium]|nr:prepilin-type N-terminal cleavage/methylation domain-containing protein [Deltaproteobacteria bacterium]
MLSDQKGFTLLEIVVVFIILGILIAVAIPKFFHMPEDAAESSLKTAVVELNARENLAWGRWKSDKVNYTVNDIKSNLQGFIVSNDNTLISSYSFKRKAVVSRTPPTGDTPGRWVIIQFTY